MPTRHDFNGDGIADIFLYDPSVGGGSGGGPSGTTTNGYFTILLSGGGVFTALADAIPYTSGNSPDGVGFFSNDGFADVMRQGTAGFLGVQVGAATGGGSFTQTGGAYDLGASGLLYTGDFDGNGVNDIVRTDGGGVTMTLFSGLATQSGSASIGPIETGYQFASGLDFNDDGKGDILLINSTTGGVAIWTMDGLTRTNAAVVAVYDTSWSFKGAGDVDGDGDADIVWQNNAGTAVAIWKMEAGVVQSAAAIAISDPTWRLEEVADYNGDGKADILWQNSGGLLAVWSLDGYNVTAVNVVASPGPDWFVL